MAQFTTLREAVADLIGDGTGPRTPDDLVLLADPKQRTVEAHRR